MSAPGNLTAFQEGFWAWAQTHADPIWSWGSLLSTLWFASLGLFGLLLFMEPEASLLRLIVFVFSVACLLAAAGAFTVASIAQSGRRRGSDGRSKAERRSWR